MKYLIFILAIFYSVSNYAFNYLEHAYFTDYSCVETKKQLFKKINKGNELLKSKYMALSMYCPKAWNPTYCSNDYKVNSSLINNLKSSPEVTGDYSITLGDVSALADHIANFGSIQKRARLKNEGFLNQIEEWLEEENESASGIYEDVAEDSCEVDEKVNWEQVDKDLQNYLSNNFIYDHVKIRGSHIALNKGPNDPAGLYTFDNPQYLDLILNNHHHFGLRSYETWLAYHSIAIEISSASCEEYYKGENNCEYLFSLLRNRVLEWFTILDDEEKKVFEKEIELFTAKKELKDSSFFSRLTSDFMALNFEGAGLHYLQDNISSGHLRGNRGDYNLEDARYFHDEDSKNGVYANFYTSSESSKLYLYGDDYLLGKGAVDSDGNCDPQKLNDPASNTNCILAKQRGLLVGSSISSLIDWSLGGLMYDADCDGSKHSFICKHLPTKSTESSSFDPPSAPKRIVAASLPQPPPSFSYQSINVSSAFDKSQSFLHNGIRISLLESLGSEAGWLTSYNLSLVTAHGDNYGKEAIEFSYMFHFRWATRFLLNAAPYLEFGKQTKNSDSEMLYGVGTNFGVTLLPEGWIRLPLELSLTVKTPLNLYDPQKLKTSRAENSQIFEISLGLAFL